MMPQPIARAVFAGLLVLLSYGMAPAATPAGAVVAIAGLCYVEADGKRVALKAGDKVNIADTVDVSAGAKLKLRMNDGSIVSMASGSRMTISAYTVDAGGQRRDVELSLAQGLIRAVVTQLQQGSRFEVKTAVGSAGVRSTDWFIETLPTATTVSVLSGSVALTGTATGASVTIPAGSGASVAPGQDPTPPRALRKAEFNALTGRTTPPQRPAAPGGAPQQRQGGGEDAPGPSPQPAGGAYPGGYNPGSNSPGGYNPGGSYPGGYNPGYNPGGYNPGATGSGGPPGGYNPGGSYPGGSYPGGSYGSGSGTYPGGGYQSPGGYGPLQGGQGTGTLPGTVPGRR